MESDPTRMCELLLGCPTCIVLGIDDADGEPFASMSRPVGHGRAVRACGVIAQVKDRPGDAGRPSRPSDGATRLVWHKRRFALSRRRLRRWVSWTEEDAADRRTADGDDRPGRALGHRAGGPLRAERQRGGQRARL